MLKTYLYVPDHLNEQIVYLAKTHKKSKAEVIRQALEVGVAAVGQKPGGGAEVLLKLAEIGKKYKLKGPKDLSKNMDKYLWG